MKWPESISFAQLSNSPVFWVVLSLAIVISPHLSRFPAWSVVLIIVLFAWRLLCIRRTHWHVPKWLLVIISIVTMLGIYLHFETLAGKTAGSVLLSLLLAIKLHESQSQRDYMLLISLSFFIIVTNFLFSQSIPTVIYMLLATVILIMSMLSISQGSANLTFRYKLKFSTQILLQSIPLMLIMFVLFPRVSGPIWQFPQEKQQAITGLSNTMSPGNISNLIQSNAVAFRVKFDDKIPAQSNLYWRAIVLWYFDGNTWEQGKTNRSPNTSLNLLTNKTINYTITLEPHNKTWLYALDIPYRVPDSVNYTNNYNLRSWQKVNNLFQYKVTSVMKYIIQATLSPWEKSAGLKIPHTTNPKTIQMGKQLAQQYSKPEDIVSYVLNMFNQQNYHYTLRPPLTPGLDSVDKFLFETKRGFCEHYASSFTLLMRAAGIPARIVMGFQGGTVNPLNQIMTVHNSDAHAWSEVWLENRGWVRVDPTAAIAPKRIEQSLQEALEPDEARPFHMQINSGLIKKALFYWDAIDNQWNQWVVGYDKEKQLKFLQTLLNSKTSFSNIIIIMVTSFTCVLLVLSLLIMKPWRREKIDPVMKVYNDYCHKLASRGIVREPYEGPFDFATRASTTLPKNKNSIELITRLYTKLRYEEFHNERQFQQLKNLVRKFKPIK